MNNSQIEYVLKRDDGRYLMLDAKPTAEYKVGASTTDELRLAHRSQKEALDRLRLVSMTDTKRWTVVPVRVTVEEVDTAEVSA